MSKIEWVKGDDGSEGETWNPLTGCSRISPGCGGNHPSAGPGGGCYAERQAYRLEHNFGMASYAGTTRMTDDGPRWTGKINLIDKALAKPLSWKDPTRIFVNSMSDLFHKDVPFEFVAAVFGVIALTPRHSYQILTKRADRLREFFAWCEKREKQGREMFPDDSPGWRIQQMCRVALGRRGVNTSRKQSNGNDWPLPNLWPGVSVEDRKYGLPRIDELRDVPAVVRMLSIEPLLEDLGTINLRGIGWLVVGAESGPNARRMDDDWVRSIRDQCIDAKVPFFFKQRAKNGVKISMPELDGRQWMQFPGGEATPTASRVSLPIIGGLPGVV